MITGIRLYLAIGGALALIVIIGLIIHAHDKGVIAKHEAGIAAKVEASQAAGANAAATAVALTQSEVEKRNAEARDAAARSDDPLRSGFDSLRTGSPSPRARPR